MFSEFQRLAKHSLIYGASNVLSKFLGFLLLPLYTKYLTPDDYGILEIFTVTSGFIAIIIEMGMGSALFRSIIYLNRANEKVLISTSFYFLLIFSFVIIIPLCIYSKGLSLILFNSLKYSYLLRIIFITNLIDIIGIVPFAKLRIHEKSTKLSVINILGLGIGLVLNIYYVAILKRGVEGIIVGGLIGSILINLIKFSVILKDLKLNFSIKELKDMLEFGGPLVPASIASTILVMSDRYFLQYYSTLNEVGLYSVGYKFAMIMSIIVGAFQTAWPAVAFSNAKKNDAKIFFSKILTYFIFILTFFGLCLSLFTEDALRILTTTKFYSAYKVVPLIVISYIFYGAYFISSIGMHIKKKNKYLPPIICFSALINLLLNYLLIPNYGMMGAAFATAISYIAMSIITCKISLKLYHVDYEYIRLLKIAAAAISVYFLGFLFVRTTHVAISIGIKSVIILLYPLFLVIMKFFTKEEFDKIKRYFLINILSKNRLGGMRIKKYFSDIIS